MGMETWKVHQLPLPSWACAEKIKKEGSETSEKLESHMFGGGAQKACCDSLSIVKLELKKDFFPQKICKPFCL